jgi:hypothetical protein
MPEPDVPREEIDTFESERPRVVSRLEQKFPDVDSAVVAEVVDRTAKATEHAKVRSFRALLVEHAARDELARLTAWSHGRRGRWVTIDPNAPRSVVVEDRPEPEAPEAADRSVHRVVERDHDVLVALEVQTQWFIHGGDLVARISEGMKVLEQGISRDSGTWPYVATSD